MIIIHYNLPQYLFHDIRYSSDVILHFHHLMCFDAASFKLKCTEDSKKENTQLLRRLKNIGLISWKLHRNTLINLHCLEINIKIFDSSRSR